MLPSVITPTSKAWSVLRPPREIFSGTDPENSYYYINSTFLFFWKSIYLSIALEVYTEVLMNREQFDLCSYL